MTGFPMDDEAEQVDLPEFEFVQVAFDMLAHGYTPSEIVKDLRSVIERMERSEQGRLN